MQPQRVGARSAKIARPNPVHGWFVGFFGLLFVVGGVAVGIIHQLDMAALTGRATGTVVDYHAAMSARGWLPVVRFTTATGEPVKFTSTLSSSPPRFRVGEQVTVDYDPANPSNARIDSFVDNWAIPLMFGSAGLIVFLIGFLIASGRLKPVPRRR